jgi:glycine cleavage system H protein
MAVLLALLSIAVFMLIDIYLNRRASETLATPEKVEVQLPATKELESGRLHYHPGQCWVRAPAGGEDLVTVGCSEFGARFAGALARIEMPALGSQLEQGTAGWTLVSRRGRRLTQVAPISGKVVEVNYDLLKEPDLVVRSPLSLGWILKVRPHHLKQGLANLMAPALALNLLDTIKARLVTSGDPALGAMAADGGQWSPDLGDQLDDESWLHLRAELFPVPATDSGTGSGSSL